MNPPISFSPAWLAARRILCVRLDGLSGVLMCTPALRALRGGASGDSVDSMHSLHAPPRSLTLLCSAGAAAALPFIPELDDAIAADALEVEHGAVTTLASVLQARAFDAAVVFTPYTGSALPAARLCRQAGIPLCLAYCREPPDGLLSDPLPDPDLDGPVRHEVQRQLALVRHIGCAPRGLGLSFVPRAGDHAAAEAHLRSAGIDPDRPWMLLHPGAGAAVPRYPPGQWGRVIALLFEATATALPLVVAGSAAEIPLVQDIRRRAGLPTHSLAGRLTLGELGALIQRAALALTNHGAPAHMANAVGTPLVDLYALTHPQHTPWGGRSRVLFHDVPCRFCLANACPQGHQECLAGVAPARVADAVRGLLDARRPQAHEER
jgi:ADP-heptose:LPS heptosyltransferase